MKFKDRNEAGRQLSSRLKTYAGRPDVLVLALSVGGLPVGAEIATALNVQLDIFLMRRLGVPGRDGLTMGTITTGGTRVLNDEVVNYLGIPEETIEAVVRKGQRELEHRERLYRGERPAPNVRGRTVILVDDGWAPAVTIHAALTALWKQGPAYMIVALPVIASTTREAIAQLPDEIVCVDARLPEPFFPDGIWYEDFRQPTDAEASQILSDSLQAPSHEMNFHRVGIFPTAAKISDDLSRRM